MKNELYSAEKVISIFQKILDTINEISIKEGKLYGLVYNDFLEIYPFFNEKSEVGIVIVDQTGGSYPLVLYKNHQDRNTLRVDAFCASLREIIEKSNTLLPLIQNEISKNWDESLEGQITQTLNPKHR